ncbi:MAG: nucleoside hydrolase [Candidatus Helarchaeota archaeon]
MKIKFDNILVKIIFYIIYLILIILGVVKRRIDVPTTVFPKREIIHKKKDIVKKDIERLIIIDDDVGMFWEAVWKYGHYIVPWLKITDPDGGLELIYGLREPDINIKVVGITIMMGVATTDVCVQAAKNILKVLGIDDIPVIQGAKTPKDLGVETEATRFIVDTVMNNPGKVEIIATGPLTNIATAIMIEPKLPENWRALHFATGEFRGALGEVSDLYLSSLVGIPDLNINVDVEATKYVLEHGGSFPIYPNEVMDDLLLSRDDYNEINNAKTDVSNFIAYELRLHNFIFNSFGQGIIPHGVVPIALALDPSYQCSYIESAVVLKDFGHQGYAFVLSNDPKLPKHKIYSKIKDRDKKRMHQTLLKRLV